MIKYVVKYCYVCILLACASALWACSAQHVDLHTDAHHDVLRKDVSRIEEMYPQAKERFDDIEPAAGPVSLTLKKALRRGVLYNLDARVSAMEILAEKSDISIEQLRMLPSMKATGAYRGRTNSGATSSFSVLSGQQSLEPSQSAEQNRRTLELEASWNLIDAALAISESRNAKEETLIAGSRYKKVIQNIQRDIYAAYWRALVYQQHSKQTEQLCREVDEQIRKTEKALESRLISSDAASEKITALSTKKKELIDAQSQMAFAEIELKSLLSLPPETEIVLDANTSLFDRKYKELLEADIADLEWEALTSRPEVEEEILKKNIVWRNTRQEFIRTVPGLELFLGRNYDSNKFLQDLNWTNYSARITQSLTAMLTLPARVYRGKNEEHLADARRQALVLAVMAQTRIARLRLETARDEYETDLKRKKAADKRAFSAQTKYLSGFQSGSDLLLARLDKQLTAMQTKMAEAQMQDAYAAFANTLGREIVPVGMTTSDKAEGEAS